MIHCAQRYVKDGMRVNRRMPDRTRGKTITDALVHFETASCARDGAGEVAHP
jgi:hypothetical protein